MNESTKKMIGYASAKIMNIPIELRLIGDQAKTHVIETVIETSQHLFETLHDPKACMSDIRAKLVQKRKAARNFKRHFGFTWPL